MTGKSDVLMALAAMTLPSVIDAAACDMAKLQPVLGSADATQCRQVGSVFIPVASASPYYVGIQTEYLSKATCSSPSCGRFIAALKALKTGECQMTTQMCYMGGCVSAQVNLYSQSIDVVETYCNGSLNYDGTSTEPPTSSTTRPAPVSETTTTAPPPSRTSTSTSTAIPTIYPQPSVSTFTPPSSTPATTSPPSETTSSQSTDTETVGSSENTTTVSNANATATVSPSPTTTKSNGGYTAMSSCLVILATATSLLIV